jgi:hypothetical protein
VPLSFLVFLPFAMTSFVQASPFVVQRLV